MAVMYDREQFEQNRVMRVLPPQPNEIEFYTLVEVSDFLDQNIERVFVSVIFLNNFIQILTIVDDIPDSYKVNLLDEEIPLEIAVNIFSIYYRIHFTGVQKLYDLYNHNGRSRRRVMPIIGRMMVLFIDEYMRLRREKLFFIKEITCLKSRITTLDKRNEDLVEQLDISQKLESAKLKFLWKYVLTCEAQGKTPRQIHSALVDAKLSSPQADALLYEGNTLSKDAIKKWAERHIKR